MAGLICDTRPKMSSAMRKGAEGYLSDYYFHAQRYRFDI